MDAQVKQIHTQTKRVVLMGPESTGKSSLAKALAETFNTVYVEEYMRTYLEKKWREEDKLCEIEDIQPIVEGQTMCENKTIKKANELIFCDTNALQNLIYAKEYYPNYRNSFVENCANSHRYDLYLLCDIDVPWEDDMLRDKPLEREKMFNIFANALYERNINFTIVSGTLKERLEFTIPLVRKLIC
jgi:NadR type nicotinamide-nucleotide adenylyltransferase